MTPEPNRPDEREAADVLARLREAFASFGAGPANTLDIATLDRAIALLRRDAPREGASVEAARVDGRVGTLIIEKDPLASQGKSARFSYANECLNLPVGAHHCYLTPPSFAEVTEDVFDAAVDAYRDVFDGNNHCAALRHALTAALADRAPREGGEADNSRAGSVTVPRCDLLALLEGNLAAANIVLSIHPLIDRIEENGGPDADDDTEQMAYHLYYTLSAAARLRDIAEKPE